MLRVDYHSTAGCQLSVRVAISRCKDKGVSPWRTAFLGGVNQPGYRVRIMVEIRLIIGVRARFMVRSYRVKVRAGLGLGGQCYD